MVMGNVWSAGTGGPPRPVAILIVQYVTGDSGLEFQRMSGMHMKEEH